MMYFISSCRAAAVWAVFLSCCHMASAGSIVDVDGGDGRAYEDRSSAVAASNDVHCPSRNCDCRMVGDDNDDIIARCRALPVVFDMDDNSSDVWSPPLAGLSFARAGLSSLPAGGPFMRLPTRALDLSGNQLSKSGSRLDDAFDGLGEVLRVLAMADCSLTRVPTRAIRNLTELRTLQLDGNKIVGVKRGSFKNNRRLVELSLRRNGLKRLDAGSFEGLAMLRELRLSDNRLARLPARVFETLGLLVRLDLSENFIHRVTASTFRGLSARLAWLELKSNLVRVVARSTFAGLTSLVTLELERNPVLDIENGSFAELRRLEHLSIDLVGGSSGNSSTGDLSTAFRGLAALKTLSFGQIGVDSLPKGVFSSMRSLRYLSLGIEETNAKFDGLRLEHFRSDMNFRQLNIWAGAIYQCRCSADWIRQLVERGASVQGLCGSNQQIQCAPNWHQDQ